MRLLTTGLICLVTAATHAADVISSPAERYADGAPTASDTPDFQKHLVPLLSRLGCNGRACHGAFSGQGGLRLSLFGYDFKADHEALAARVDTANPAGSYALEKAVMATPHKGGKRLAVGSWEYNLFLAWVKSGAKPVSEEDGPIALEQLEVTPSEVSFQTAGQTQQMRVVAHWADGTQEDVTRLCRFQANDPQVCDIDANGLVVANDPGDTHIVAFYDMAVVPIPVLRPVSDKFGPNYPPAETPTRVDELVVDKLRKLGLAQSEPADDAQFLRRVSLDLTGTLPTAAEVRAFLGDSTPGKRDRKIDELLESPAYAAWWATRLCDWTGNSDQQLNNVGIGRVPPSQAWYEWIQKRVADNTPYDKLIEGIVLATSRKPGESYEEYCVRECDRYRAEESYATQDGLTYFWGRRNFLKPEDRAMGFAYTFLGTRIQCAQCHKHPFDQWTQDDFQHFQAFFTRVRYDQTGSDKETVKKMLEAAGVEGNLKGNDLRKKVPELIKAGKTLPLPELHVTAAKTAPSRKDVKKPNSKNYRGPDSATAKLLGGGYIEIGTVADPRVPLMAWLREHPLFARSFVNRVWANYFHRGIVEPTDDMSLANPPCNEALLDYLAKDFVASGFDIKHLHRTIVHSRTYQTSWRPNATNMLDERNFSRAVPRRLPAEIAADAVLMATTSDAKAAEFRTALKGRSIAAAAPPRNNATTGVNYALSVFGRSTRENNCDCDRSADVSLLQTLYLRNDQDILNGMNRGGDGWLNAVARELKVAFNPATSQEDDGAEARRKQAKKRRKDLQAQLKKGEEALAKANELKDEKRIKAAEDRLEKLQKAMTRVDEVSPPEPEPLTPEQLAEQAQAAAGVLEASISNLIEEAYLRTVSRFPTDSERQLSAEFIKQAPDPMSGLRDLLWALLNTKEFILNH